MNLFLYFVLLKWVIASYRAVDGFAFELGGETGVRWINERPRRFLGGSPGARV
jgi:hypothetical protein